MKSGATDAAEIYDAFAEKYRAYSNTKTKYIEAVDALVAQALSSIDGPVLDYGAGDGVRGAGLAHRLGFKPFYQADISKEMVARCRQLGVSKQVFLVSEDNWASQVPDLAAIFCLWNVLGHLPDTSSRKELLSLLRSTMSPDAVICIDVNNRHYAGYGWLRSLGRRVLDAVSPDYTRGDVKFTWEIDGTEYPASGHFFTPAEMKDLIESAGFRIETVCSVDYQTGRVSPNLSKGQLFYSARAIA